MQSVPPAAIGRSRVGRYEVIYPLAQGGMASVHVGRLLGMAGFEKLVAIKVIHPHLSDQTSFVRMFLDEARLAARIHHPNVGEVIEVGEDSGVYYMVCELVVGQSLRDLVRRARQLEISVPPAQWADITAKVCQGLHEAHELRNAAGDLLGLVHRDVSPRNILVSYNGFVKLIDFGIAWAQERITHTDAGSLKGKIGFMSPEQIRGEQLDRRADIFAVGVMLYMLATGSLPFFGKSDGERMNKILNGSYLPPRELCPSIDPALEKIIVTALENNRDNRLATANQMARELMGFVHSSSESPADWDSSTEISALMHRCFEEDLAEHREKIRAVVDNSDAVFESIPPGRFRDHADITIADTPRSIRARRFTGRLRPFSVLAGAALAGIAVTVLVLLLRGGDHGHEPGTDDDATNLVAESEKEPVDEENAPEEPVEPPEIRIELEVTPAGATVEIDGESLASGAGWFTLPRSARRHTVTVRAEGYREATRELTASENASLIIALEPLPPARAPRAPGKAGGRKTDGERKKGIPLVDSPYS